MRLSRILLSLTLLLLIGSSLSVLADSDSMLSPQEQKLLEAQNAPAITTDQQAQIDKELALKAEALANYSPVPEPLNPYFIETAKKLNVTIDGLSDNDIMIKVKEAEVQYAIDHPVILTPKQQAEIDRLTAIKLAQSQ
jgi:hypothetical protein